MTAPLKRVNIERALRNGESKVGPWELERHDDGGEEVLDLYHYGHHLARVSKLQASGRQAQPEIDAWPRSGYSFSRSDAEGIFLLANVLGAEAPDNVRYPGGRSQYWEHGFRYPERRAHPEEQR